VYLRWAITIVVTKYVLSVRVLAPNVAFLLSACNVIQGTSYTTKPAIKTVPRGTISIARHKFVKRVLMIV